MVTGIDLLDLEADLIPMSRVDLPLVAFDLREDSGTLDQVDVSHPERDHETWRCHAQLDGLIYRPGTGHGNDIRWRAIHRAQRTRRNPHVSTLGTATGGQRQLPILVLD